MKNIIKKSSLVATMIFFAIFSFAQVKPVKPVTSSTQPVVQAGDANQNTTKGIGFTMPEGGGLASNWSIPSGELQFYSLPYGYEALEPLVDKKTVEIHYDKHHRNYYNNFKKAISETDLMKMPIYQVFATISSYSEAVRNNGGGYFNHVLYWENLTAKGEGEPSGQLRKMIEKQFGGMEKFTQQFNEVALSRFGSGWAWLSVDYTSGELFISSTANQDNPMMGLGQRMGVPILALDVWEHAYYLNYQNRRSEYIEAFWKLVNWDVVMKRYEQSQVKKADARKSR